MILEARNIAEPVPPPVPRPYCDVQRLFSYSSAMVRPLILNNIFETVPFRSRFTCTDIFPDWHSYRRADMTDAFRMRRLSRFGSLEAFKRVLHSNRRVTIT